MKTEDVMNTIKLLRTCWVCYKLCKKCLECEGKDLQIPGINDAPVVFFCHTALCGKCQKKHSCLSFLALPFSLFLSLKIFIYADDGLPHHHSQTVQTL